MRRTVVLTLASLMVFAVPLLAQDRSQIGFGIKSGGLYLTRAELQQLLRDHEQVANFQNQSSQVREDALASAARIRERLEEGDFRPGDRLVVEVRSASGGAASRAGSIVLPADTFTVRSGPSIAIEGMGDIPLGGVLRSELEPHLTQEFETFVRDPVVEATSLVRVSVQGQVGNPGFYTVPAHVPLGEVIMAAGGTGQNADLEEMRIERVDETIMEDEAVQRALADGRSLDQLSLEAGDQIVVPAQEEGNVWSTVGRYALIISSSVLLGVRIF